MGTILSGEQDEREDEEAVAPFENLKARVRNLNDTVRYHDVEVAKHGVLIGVITAQITAIHQNTVTKDQLDGAVLNINTKITHVHDDLAPIKQALYWVVGLIIGAFIFALLTLIMKGDPSNDRPRSAFGDPRDVYPTAAGPEHAGGDRDAARDRPARVPIPRPSPER